MPANRTGLHSVAGALTVAAGLVHAGAAGAHAGRDTVVVAFALTAVTQVVLGAAMVARPSPPTLLTGAALGVGVAATWAVSRTAGLPGDLLDGLGGRQAAGVQDVTATLLEVVAAAIALLAVRAWSSAEPVGPPRLSPLMALALLPALVGMAAPHAHDDTDHHDASEVAHGDPPGDAHGGASAAAADPIFSGADTSHASRQQIQAAKRLIETTRAAVAARFPDEGSLLAAGYQSIGDGRFVGSYEHFVRADYLIDGRELDPGHVESVVLERTAAGKRVVSAMYILDWGKTMEDVPDIAGRLTAWHDHQNLCWDRSGTRLAGLVLNGRCVPGGTFRPTPPMLHVWLQDHRCGPFAGIEGHGDGCGHGHTD